MPPNRGRGQARARGRGGHARGGSHATNATAVTPMDRRVCKPAIRNIPNTLIPLPTQDPIPEGVLSGLGNRFTKSQPFFSALERLQGEVASHGRVQTCWFGEPQLSLTLSEDNDTANRTTGLLGTVVDSKQCEFPVFIKATHIVDPLMTIEGECVCPSDGALPAPTELWLNTLDKVNEPNNEAYVDALFAAVADRLNQTDLSPHWLRCFGSFTGRAAHYRYNISEEYPSLRRKSFWQRNQALGIFGVAKEEATDIDLEAPAMQMSEAQEIDMDDFETADVPTVATAPTTTTTATAATTDIDGVELIEADDTSSCTIKGRPVRIYKLPTSSDSSTSSSDSSTESSAEDDGYEYFATFKNFPVQVTLLERAEGTMEDLAEEESEECWTAWIFQVIAALCAAQHWFGFVHNDLHTNNVMWVRTTQPYLYYRIHPKGSTAPYIYRVPTHGYIMKIIDFGRASYWLPEPAGFFISDAFFPGNDAGFQYNCEPFFEAKNGKRIEPNPSFDLCRLAVALLDMLFEKTPETAKPIRIMSREGNKQYAETVSPLYNMMWEWLTDDAGKNVLRTPAGDERYPNFDLYAAIAADVHRAIPIQQVEKPLFAGAFRVSEAPPTGASVYDIWVR